MFYDLTEIERNYLSNGRSLKATEIAEVADIVDLLIRDNCAYIAVSLLKSAFDAHRCCFICETSSEIHQKHLIKETEIWNHANILSDIEIAIVQSCRTVECIIGEPPNSKKLTKVLKHKNKWKEIIGIDPDECYEKAEMSYLDFYYNLFLN